MVVHPAAERAGKESPAAIEGAGGAFGHQTGREDDPQCGQRDAVAQDMLGCAAHAHRLGMQALAPGQRDAREDEEQQQVHHEVEKRLVGESGCKIFEEHVTLERHIAEAQVSDRLDPAHGDQQKPSESQRHVHVAQQRIDPEDAAVQERFADRLARGIEGRTRRQAA